MYVLKHNLKADRTDSTGMVSESRAFAVRLLRCVEKRPCLWNPSFIDYSRREKCEEAWEEISKMLGKSDIYVKEKWKNIRIGYVRSLKPMRSNTGEILPKKRFYLFNAMKFLLPIVRRKQQLANCLKDADEDSSEEDEEPIVNIKVEDFNIITPSPEPSTSIPECNISVIEPMVKKGKPDSNYVNENETMIEKNVSYSDDNLSERETNRAMLMYFFEGIAQDVLTLSSRSQLKFKRKLLEMIEGLHEEEEE